MTIANTIREEAGRLADGDRQGKKAFLLRLADLLEQSGITEPEQAVFMLAGALHMVGWQIFTEDEPRH